VRRNCRIHSGRPRHEVGTRSHEVGGELEVCIATWERGSGGEIYFVGANIVIASDLLDTSSQHVVFFYE